MIAKLLIANRGEIACRIIKTARRLGIETVAVYSTADTDAMHVMMADQAVLIGNAPASESYLNGHLIVEKAKQLSVDAIHPGYGFLSENAQFANLCEKNDILFIGPPSAAIEAMGSKSTAKQIMQQAKVPLIPGYHGDNQTAKFLHEQAMLIGYPVLLKAAAGGGGKGMRIVRESDAFDTELVSAKREALNSFADQQMLVEKYLADPRHVEIQVFCDTHGNAVYLFERDCSIQRRHQKIIEEAPAPNFSKESRIAMGEIAVTAALAIGYVGAGTVEFLYDAEGNFYFMEMNTRLQVEHPITEKITGLDLVEWQIRIASGEPLPLQQNDLSINGHAIEARIYAEDTENDFLPSTGQINYLQMPSETETIRIDTGVTNSDEVSVYYDPMIAKLVAHAHDRESAIRYLDKALKQFNVAGVKTNINYLLRILRNESFQKAQLTTNFIDNHTDDLTVKLDVSLHSIIAAFVIGYDVKQQTSASLFNKYRHFRLNHISSTNFWLTHCEQEYIANITFSSDNRLHVVFENQTYELNYERHSDTLELTVNDIKHSIRYSYKNNEIAVFDANGINLFHLPLIDLGQSEAVDHSNEIIAPMNATIVSILVSKDQQVNKNQALAVIEAMKMEQTLKSPRDGFIEQCLVEEGSLIDGGQPILTLKPFK